MFEDKTLKEKVSALCKVILEIGADLLGIVKDKLGIKANIPKKYVLMGSLAAVLIVLACLIPSGPSGLSNSHRPSSLNHGGGSVSASGTYYWSNGPLYQSITISGDRWYSSSNFDTVSSGRVRGKTLYDDSGAVPLGKILNSSSISYSGNVLRKE